MKTAILLALVLVAVEIAGAVDFFSTASVEIYRTHWGENLISPNIYFKAGKFDGYGFWDRYFTNEGFYHGEFMLAFTPFQGKYWDRLSVISESRWDKYSKQENSVGIRIRLW